MSVLKLTSFAKDITINDYNDYEKSQKPEKGEEVFVYHKYADAAANDPTDKVNFSIVRKAFGFAAKYKFDKMAVQQVKSNSGKVRGTEFINNRTTELSKMYDELTELFLLYLHKSVCNTYYNSKQ